MSMKLVVTPSGTSLVPMTDKEIEDRSRAQAIFDAQAADRKLRKSTALGRLADKLGVDLETLKKELSALT